MEMFTIIPRDGMYRVEALISNGKRELIAAYRTERAAIVRLRELQAQADHTIRRRPGAR
jgi:hypothetical protein